MGKCFIDFSVIQQDLRRTDKNMVAADAAETVAARFELGSKWNGLNVYARFQHGPEVYDVPLVDGCATIPHEVMRETGFNVSIFGESADGARLTSARVFVDVEPTISNDGAPPIPATPSLLQRIDALVHASSENAYNAAESARVAQEANAATVEIDGVDTLPAGSAATVANVGTPQDARLRFGIPKGDKGDKGSGGIPSGGVPGQVVVKTADGEGWTDANAHNHDASHITSGTMSADRLPVAGIAKGGTGGTTEQEARDNILAGVPRIDVSTTDFDADNRVNVYAMAYDEPTLPSGRMFKFDIKRFWTWIDKKIREVFGFDDLNILPISNGGTGATSPAGARDYLGAAAADHTHTAEEVGAISKNVETATADFIAPFATYGTSSFRPTFKKVGNIVFCSGRAKPASEVEATFGVDFFDVPEGFRPNLDKVFVCQGSSMNRWVLEVGSSGKASIGRYGTTTSINMPSGCWLPFDVCWIVE